MEGTTSVQLAPIPQISPLQRDNARPMAAYTPAINHGMAGAHTPLRAPTSQREVIVDSQGSYVSASSGSSAPRLQASSSNLSILSVPETELTSPTSSHDFHSQNQVSENVQRASKSISDGENDRAVRPATPRMDGEDMNDSGEDSSSNKTSAMAAGSPHLVQGAKRTASGVVKPATSGASASSASVEQGGHSRNDSQGANLNRIGELSAQLKTRLSYAMMKVQNGWERRSIDELEELQTQRAVPPPSTPGPNGFSPDVQSLRRRAYSNGRRPSLMSESSDPYLFSPNSQTSPPQHPRSRPHSSYSATGPSLAPAPDIQPSRKHRRSVSSHMPPMLSATPDAGKRYSELNSPTTPTTVSPRRAGILRMPSQQAEKDAVDTLLFMSSPNHSAHLAHASAAVSSAQPSPLRTEFAARGLLRRAVFGEAGGEGQGPDGASGRVGGGRQGGDGKAFEVLRTMGSESDSEDER